MKKDLSRMEAELFAERVVGDIFGGATGMGWRGEMASAVRFSSLLMPTSMQVGEASWCLFSLKVTDGCAQDGILSRGWMQFDEENGPSVSVHDACNSIP